MSGKWRQRWSGCNLMVITGINNKKFKKGFSLFEAFVVMLIVSIFVALMANTVAHRPKEKVASEAHGRFECYYDPSNNKLYQQLYTEGSTTGRKLATKEIEFKKDDDTTEMKKVCEFVPPSYAKYLIIDAVGGGAGGSSKGGASEGQFVSTFYASIERKYYILPGNGGKKETGVNAAENGGTTIVKNQDKEVMITAEGGKAVSSLENTTINDVLACSVTEWPTDDQYNCHITPTCQIVDGKVEVSFCRSKGSYITTQLEYKHLNNDGEVVLDNPRYIVNKVYTEQKNANTWIYHDISPWSDYNDLDTNPVKSYENSREAGWKPSVTDEWVPSLYTLELLMNSSADGDEANPSNLHRLIESMQYTSKIKDAKVGEGGAKNRNGSAGGVLILW